MSTIFRYFIISMKKNFAYPVNGIMVIVDTLMDCFSIVLFWLSLMEMGAVISDWNITDLKVFMGFSLISMGIMVLFSGGYDIQDHILDSTMDLYFVKPVSPVLLILLERANFLRFLVTFPIGAVITAKSFSGHWASYFVALALCIASTLLLGLIKVIFYELAFWLKKMDSVVQIYEAVMEIRQYPLSVFGSRLIKLFTYIVPVAFVATIPTELLTGVLPIKLLVLFLVNGILIFLIHKGIWTLGRRHYESANG